MTVARAAARVSGDRAAADRTNSRTHGIPGAFAPGARPAIRAADRVVGVGAADAGTSGGARECGGGPDRRARASLGAAAGARPRDRPDRDVGGASTGASNATRCETAGCHSTGCEAADCEAAGCDSAGGHAAAGGAARPLDTGCTGAGREATDRHASDCDTCGRGTSTTAEATGHAASAPRPPAGRAIRACLRLGEPGRRQAVFRDRRHRARARGRVLPALLGAAGLAAAARARAHWHPGRDLAAGALRAESGEEISGHGKCARRRGDCHSLCDVLRRARALESDPGCRHVRSAGDRDRAGRPALRQTGVVVHRRYSACSAALPRRRSCRRERTGRFRCSRISSS